MRVVLVVIACLGVLPRAGIAQVGATTDIITGVVVDASGMPLPGATVEAQSLDTRVSRTATTDERGRYTILFPDGGGQYQMTARYIGAFPQTVVIVRHADEDRLLWDVQMQEGAFALDPVVVTGDAVRRPVRVPDRPTPGSIQQILTPDMLSNLPIDATDLALLATLVPGAVVIDATDSTDAAFSVAGQRPDANVTTMDGLTFASGQMPQEGLRTTRVVTSTYDVSRGRFSGGMMASVSRSGANTVQGSLSYALRDDHLAFEGSDPTAFTSGFTQHAFGGGLGGPIVGNRLLAYVSGQARFRSDAQASLTSATAADLERLGVAPDSVNRFLDIVDAIGAAPDSRFDGRRSSTTLSGMLRIDYLMSQTHTLTVRGDLRDQQQEPVRLGASALPETSGDNASDGGGLLVGLSSRFGQRVINEFRAYGSANTRGSEPYWTIPQGRVQVGSELADRSVGFTTLTMGGSSSMPSNATTDAVEVTDELSWMPGAASHRMKVGGLFRAERISDYTSANQWGTYQYASLAALETGAPSSFRRILGAPERTIDGTEFAVYAADVWIPARTFQINYGLRAEHSGFGNAPDYNPELDASLGVRTDRLPSEFDLSPRAGVTWQVGGGAGGIGMAGMPAFIVRGGVGKFRSPMPTGLVSQAQSSTGLTDTESILECIGPLVPAPDWTMFQQDAAMIPSSCSGTPSVIDPRAPAVAVFAQDFGSPKAWRASLGVQKNLTTLLRVSLDFNYARGVDQYGFRDLNLDTAGGFRMATEADRPVFVDPQYIVPETGAVSSRVSRIDSSYAQVLEMMSDLESDTKQVTASLNGVTRSGVVMRLSYTWSHVRDQGGPGGRGGGGQFGGTSTSGNPNVPEWGRSSLERQHAFLTTVSYPFGSTVDLTAIGRVSSGVPYTPMVAADINGDGVANDQAYVFSPEVLPAMAPLLASTSGAARSCLANQLGTIAERNSCVGPWQGALDLQLNYRPNFWGMNRRVTVSLTTVNLLHGVDQLLHGTSGLKGWGMQIRPDDNLLFVTGFDPAANQFTYEVNERFGVSDPQAVAFRQPFQIGVQVRATFGPDRGRDALLAMRGAGRGGGFGGGFGGMRPGMRGGFTGEDFLDRFRSLLINPAELVLDYVDTLDLTADQVTTLVAMRDSLQAVNDSVGAALRQEVDAAGSEDPRALIQLIRPRMEEAAANVRSSLAAVRGVLTDEQWGRLPEQVRQLDRRGQPGRRRPE